WDFQCPDDLPCLSLTLEHRRNVYMIYKEVLHNAAKHSGATEIRIEVSLVRRSLRVAVIDNGKGIGAPGAAKNSGFGGNGMRNVRRRAQSLRATAQWKTPAIGGVEFELIVPL